MLPLLSKSACDGKVGSKPILVRLCFIQTLEKIPYLHPSQWEIFSNLILYSHIVLSDFPLIRLLFGNFNTPYIFLVYFFLLISIYNILSLFLEMKIIQIQSAKINNNNM